MFGWLKNRRRRQLLETPFPEAWPGILDAVPHYRVLPQTGQAKLRDNLRIFIAEKEWEGCRGLEITDEMKVTIAALACLLVLGMDDFHFDNVQTILLYPAGFVARDKKGLADGTYLEGDSERLGEAHYRGPVILSWDEIQADLHNPRDGCNLVMHEFAHQLDMLNGEADGVPLLPAGLTQRWQKVMLREYNHLCRLADRGVQDTLIDPYGANDPAEFFAVVTESFFNVPVELQSEHPRLYDVLKDYYRQDPAGWFA
jgi:MtfA peptidase